MGSETTQYFCHVLGLVDIMRGLYWKGANVEETIQQVFYGHIYQEVRSANILPCLPNDNTHRLTDSSKTVKAMLRGEMSAFEGSTWANMPAPVPSAATWPGYSSALQVTMQTFIQLSRLTYLTREAEIRPADEECRVEAVDLAALLLKNDLEWWVEQLQTSHAVQVVPSINEDVRSQVAYSFHFQSPRLYHILVEYWAGRVLLCGCIQRLGALPPTTRTFSSLNIAAAQDLDVQSARNVAMCLDYALHLDDTVPFAPMRQRLMLRVVFGAWHRYEERGAELGLVPSASGTRSPTEMKTWCLSALNKIETHISHQLSTEHELVRMATCLSGGAVYEPVSITTSSYESIFGDLGLDETHIS